MPVLNNPKHEKFAQHLAQGSTATEAYRLAGYKPSRFNASKLANNPAVKGRVIQITTKHGVAAAVTVESLIAETEEVRKHALESRQLSAAIGAIKEEGILSGVRVEKKEVGQPGEFDHLSDDELLASIRERWERINRSTQHLAISDGSILLNGASRTLKDQDR